MDFSQHDIELQDIESGKTNTNTNSLEAQNQIPAPLPQSRSTWGKNLITESLRVQTGLSTASIKSHWSIQWVARWTPRQSPLVATPLLSSDPVIVAAQEEYLIAVTGKATRSEIVESACQWQIKFLSSQIGKAWIPLFRRVLNGVDNTGLAPTENELSITFKVLAAMVEQFRRDDRALVQIVDELYNSGVLIETEEPGDSDYERPHANQMVFTALGLISMLYLPELNPANNKFQISTYQAQSTRTSGTPEHRRLTSKSKTYNSYKQDLDHKDQNVALLLRRFGKIIPHCQRSIFTGQNSPGPGFAPLIPDISLEVSLLNFRNLCKAVGINVEWVDCLSLHLEFDHSGKVLKLFRFPSVCLMMCCGREPSTFAQIFADSMSYNNPSTSDLDEAQAYYREVLLSYRLIFGQVRGSAEDFNSRAHDWAPALAEHSDPILAIICGQNWESEEAYSIYEEIGAEETAERYSPSEDFPYLGKRLLKLQEYVRDHRPNNLWQLWHDQANKWNWWMLWAFVILGCLALLFAIIQTALQIIQVIYTIHPVRI